MTNERAQCPACRGRALPGAVPCLFCAGTGSATPPPFFLVTGASHPLLHHQMDEIAGEFDMPVSNAGFILAERFREDASGAEAALAACGEAERTSLLQDFDEIEAAIACNPSLRVIETVCSAWFDGDGITGDAA